MSLDNYHPAPEDEPNDHSPTRPQGNEITGASRPTVPLKSETTGDSNNAQATPSRRSRRTSAAKRKDLGWWIGGFLFGFALGLVLSLTYGWLLDPRPAPITPASLNPQHKALYLRLVALAFAHNKDEAQALARLATLEDPEIETTVARLTEQYIDQEKDIRDIVALVELSSVFGQTTAVMAAFIATPTPAPSHTPTLAPTPTPRPTNTSTPSPTRTPRFTSTATPRPSPTRTPSPTRVPTRIATPTRPPTPSRTPTPTNTPTPGPDAPFGVAQSVVLCDDTTKGGLLRIYVRDRLSQGVPGVKITVTWPGGQDTFFTGFKPKVDPGYADFQMEPGQRYQVELTSAETAGQTTEVNIDRNTLCPGLSQNVEPSWQIVFQQGAGG